MINKWLSQRKKGRGYGMFKRQRFMAPDEVFMDALNVSSLDQQQLEGVIEQDLDKGNVFWVKLGVVLVMVLFMGRLAQLQIVEGQEHFDRSESNRLHEVPIYAQRGVIFDYKGEALAWNVPGTEDEPFLSRKYIDQSGFGHILGYVTYPERDDNGFYWREGIIGKEGIERMGQESLKGVDGAQFIETDVYLTVLSTHGQSDPEHGENVYTTIDSELQTAMYQSIATLAENSQYEAGAGVVIDIHSGALRVLASYPEYDPQVMADGENQDEIKRFLASEQGYFLNRAVSGLYTPGSIVKPFVALTALQEGVITQNTTVNSIGRIEVENQYNPDEPSVFRDWNRSGHGITDVRHAIAQSVNTFFYAISGGWENIEGMGIDTMSSYLHSFGMGQKTGIEFFSEPEGVVPTPQWKQEIFDDNWRLGDTYITSIGQFGFQVTPLGMARATAALANGGSLIAPHIITEAPVSSGSGARINLAVDAPSEAIPDTNPTDTDVNNGEVSNEKNDEFVQYDIDNISQKYYQIIHEGMRDTVLKGTARNLKELPIDIAAKTGTAQVSVAEKINNSWIIGFYPYDDPEYAVAIVMERGPAETMQGANVALESYIRKITDSEIVGEGDDAEEETTEE